MSITVLGINHHTAEVALREKLAFPTDTLVIALQELNSLSNVLSAVIVSTCNRSEIYCELIDENIEPILNWMSSFHQINIEKYRSHLYAYQQKRAIIHLMQVACGLDSLILGEPQILGQIKKAYQISKQNGCISGILERLFQQSFHVAKEVRSSTDIGEHPVSVAFSSCLLARELFSAINDVNVMLVGAGENIELTTRHMCHANHYPKQLVIANRTKENAQSLANEFNGDVISLEEITQHLPQMDIIISSTASSEYIINYNQVQEMFATRSEKPLLIIDIAVPRDIDPNIADLPNVYLYTLDDLQSIIEKNQEQRKLAAVQAQDIVLEHVTEFMQWHDSRQAVSHIKAYRNKASSYKEEQIQLSLQALNLGEDPKTVIQNLADKLTNKLIHAPTNALQEAGKQTDSAKLDAICKILGL